MDNAAQWSVSDINQLLSNFALSTGVDAQFLGAGEGASFITSGECAGSAFCSIVMSSDEGLKRCVKCHADAGAESANLGEAYIMRCHAGVIMITAPVLSGDEYIGCLSCAPAIMWDWDETAVHEFIQRTSDLPISSEAVLVASHGVQVLSGKQARALSGVLGMIAATVLNPDKEALITRRAITRQQSELADIVVSTKRKEETLAALEGHPSAYPMHMERELLSKVRLGDRAGARGILNELLGQIFYRMAGNVELMKARVLELVVMVSRTAVESGAGLEKLLGLNYHFIAELSTLTSYEDICQWVVKVLDTFMDTVYDTRNVKNVRFLGDALAFIRGEYMHNLTLDTVAQHVHISPYYLSHLFKEELDITFIEYLTRVRIEEARRLLFQTSLSIQEITQRVGYVDPSYFSRVFKKVTGMTPNRFRRGGNNRVAF